MWAGLLPHVIPTRSSSHDVFAEHSMLPMMGDLDSAERTSVDLLEDARVGFLPPDAFYIPNFVTSDEETYLLSKVRPLANSPF